MDEIIINKTQKLSAAREASAFLDSDYYSNNFYQVDKMSLEETKEKLDWRKRAFEYKQKKSYGIENRNDMMRINQACKE